MGVDEEEGREDSPKVRLGKRSNGDDPGVTSAMAIAKTPEEVQMMPTPNVEDVEKAVIGAMLLDNSCIPKIRSVLPESKYFYQKRHKQIYEVITKLADSGVPADQVTVVQRLISDNTLDSAGGAFEVASLASEMATSSNAEFHARLVLECWRKREAIIILQQNTQALFDNGADTTISIDKTVQRLQQVQSLGQGGVIGERSSYRGPTILERRKAGMLQRIRMSPIETGYSALDRRLVQPFFPGGLTAIAARPSVGKSALKANLTVNLCEGGYGVQSVTPEQGFDREMDRLDSIYTDIPLWEIKGVRDWKPGDPRVAKVLKANGEVYSDTWNFSLMPRRDVSWSDIENQVLMDELAGHKTHVIFVDLMDRLQEIRGISQGEKANAITSLLMRASEFAQKTMCHVVMLAQISRDVKLNDDGRPSLATIKGSGGWEEVCDNVMLLHAPSKTELDIIIGKQRDGEAGDNVVVRLPFDTRTLSLGNRDYRNVNDPKGVSRLSLRPAA